MSDFRPVFIRTHRATQKMLEREANGLALGLQYIVISDQRFEPDPAMTEIPGAIEPIEIGGQRVDLENKQKTLNFSVPAGVGDLRITAVGILDMDGELAYLWSSTDPQQHLGYKELGARYLQGIVLKIVDVPFDSIEIIDDGTVDVDLSFGAIEADVRVLKSDVAVIQQRLSDAELALYSQIMKSRAAMFTHFQSGIVRPRDHSWKSDGYDVELEPDHVSFSIFSEHTHRNYLISPTPQPNSQAYVSGLAEMQIVVHDFEQTAHVDPSLVTPIPGDWLSTRPIVPHDVPAAILSKPTVDERIAEAREWGKAFLHRDTSIRPYKPFCKVLLMVMEGWDQVTDPTNPVLSFRHRWNGSGLHDLQKTADFYAHTGSKPVLENDPFVPIGLMAAENAPGQLFTSTYRMHATELGDLTTHSPDDCLYLRQDADVNWRKGAIEADEFSAFAHYGIRHEHGGAEQGEFITSKVMADEWMSQVWGHSPGADLRFTQEERRYGSFDWVDPVDRVTPLNAARYHRFYTLPNPDATGTRVHRAFFGNPSLWVSLNNRPEIMPWIDPGSGRNYPATYAFPFSVFLLNWWHNPAVADIAGVPYVADRGAITGDGRTPETAYSGWHENGKAWILPADMFDDGANNRFRANTGGGKVWVMCEDGVAREMYHAGLNIWSMPIDDASRRLRFDVAPLAHDGNPAVRRIRAQRRHGYDEAALADMLLKQRFEKHLERTQS